MEKSLNFFHFHVENRKVAEPEVGEAGDLNGQ